jgi:hypothetical protein
MKRGKNRANVVQFAMHVSTGNSRSSTKGHILCLMKMAFVYLPVFLSLIFDHTCGKIDLSGVDASLNISIVCSESV